MPFILFKIWYATSQMSTSRNNPHIQECWSLKGYLNLIVSLNLIPHQFSWFRGFTNGVICLPHLDFTENIGTAKPSEVLKES